MATHDEFERLLDGVRDGSEAAASEPLLTALHVAMRGTDQK